MSMGNGKKDYYINQYSDLEAAYKIDITKPSLYHKTNFDSPIKNIFGWIDLRPHIDLMEYWIWTYTEQNILSAEEDLIEKDGFKRRLTWNSSLSANTKIYGLLSIKIGRLNAIRHVITPTIRYSYTPDFANPKFGYFQQNSPTGEPVDYFQDYSATSIGERKKYTLKINNLFQAKIRNEKGDYDKVNFLTLNSSISYNPLNNNSSKLGELISNINIKNLSGHQLIRISMNHNFYRFGDEELINIWRKELPRLTSMNLATDMKFKLLGLAFTDFEKSVVPDTTEDFDTEFYNEEDQEKLNNGSNLWETTLGFRYKTNWEDETKKWNYTFSLNTIHKINLSKNWSLSYTADFNLKEKEIIRNKFSIHRPIHCWEFSFSYWPGNSYSSGFSLQINVKNPDLRDIKLTSKDSNRGFGSF